MVHSVLYISIKKSQLWKSCKYHHLICKRDYNGFIQKPFKEIFIDSVNRDKSQKALENLFKKNQFDTFIILDPGIDLTFIVQIILKYNFANKIKLIIHLYGNFIRQSNSFITFINQLSIKPKIKYIIASKRFASALEFMTKSKKGIYVKRMYYQVSLTNKSISFRNEIFGSFSREHVFGYAGRLEHSKNIITLINTFSNPRIYKKSILAFAGSIDNGNYSLGDSAFGKLFYEELLKCISSKKKEIRERIFFLGELDNKQIFNFYTSIDTLINLSTFSGEVFGIGNSQALDLGIDLITTDWGGFVDHFQNYDKKTLIPIKICSFGRLELNTLELLRQLDSRVNNLKINPEKRGSVVFEKSPTLKIIFKSQAYSYSTKLRYISEKKWTLFMSGRK